MSAGRPVVVRRFGAMLCLAALLAVTLAGCVDLDTTLSLDGTARATGHMRITVAKQAAALAGVTDLDSFKKQLNQQGGTALPHGIDASFTQNDDSYLATYALDHIALSDTDMNAKVVGDTIAFNFVNTATDSGSSGVNMGMITLHVRFPGDVRQVTGATRDGRRAISYSGRIDAPATITATSAIDPASALLWPKLALGVGLLVLIAGGAVVMWQRRPAGGSPAYATPAPFPPAPFPAAGFPPAFVPQQAAAPWTDQGYFAQTPAAQTPAEPPAPQPPTSRLDLTD